MSDDLEVSNRSIRRISNNKYIWIFKYINRISYLSQIILLIATYLSWIALPWFVTFAPVIYLMIYTMVMFIYYYDDIYDHWDSVKIDEVDSFKFMTEEEIALNSR